MHFANLNSQIRDKKTTDTSVTCIPSNLEKRSNYKKKLNCVLNVQPLADSHFKDCITAARMERILIGKEKH